MADFFDEPEPAWDEYAWERFLQQQDSKTEKYMELFEKYIDDPNRDQIIAKEMGWPHLLGTPTDEENDFDAEAAEENEESEVQESFESHPLYQSAFALTVWVDQLLEDSRNIGANPNGIKLTSHVAVASAKLAAALSDQDNEEIGMTIAYLKRALHAVSMALEAAVAIERDCLLKPAQVAELISRLFQVRDQIVVLMGELRAEWRRRFGA